MTQVSSGPARPHVVVVGAGIGGLSATLDLAASGAQVTLLERHEAPGGKMRQIPVAGAGVDSGPTVFTMRWVFEELFAAAGRSLGEHLNLTPAELLARHAWLDGSRLDLHTDLDRSVSAIAELAGPGEADAYRRFAAQSQRIFETLDRPFMRAQKPGPVSLTFSMGLRGLPRLYATKPFSSLWQELERTFQDPRLRQLFGRYATYCGSSPYRAPATLMLIAHAERAGVWIVEGGMQRLAEALAAVAMAEGASIRCGTQVERILAERGRVSGVELADGEVIRADAVVFNGDTAALSSGLLGDAVVSATPPRRRDRRSLSAITLSTMTRAEGFPLAHHTVFFGADYHTEFDSIFRRGAVSDVPTVYVCAQDRGSGRQPASSGMERIFCLINAPAKPLSQDETQQYAHYMVRCLERHGLTLGPSDHGVVTSPVDFDRLFPASSGALYGSPTHGWSGSFDRPGSRSRMKGLYLAGGGVHPGPGVPMAALSGRLAAARVRADLGV